MAVLVRFREPHSGIPPAPRMACLTAAAASLPMTGHNHLINTSDWHPPHQAGLLEALQSESPRSDGDSTPSPTYKAEEEYLAPAEATMLADGGLAGGY